jgi:hypothetical protein
VGDFCQQLTRLLDQHPELQQQVQSGDGMVLLWRLATGEGQLRPPLRCMTARLLGHASQGCHRDSRRCCQGHCRFCALNAKERVTTQTCKIAATRCLRGRLAHVLCHCCAGCPLSTVQEFVQKVDVMKSHRSPKTWVNIHVRSRTLCVCTETASAPALLHTR